MIIEGHALIYYIIQQSPSLQWSNAAGGQFLQAAYATEKLMDEILREGAVVHLVWFHVHRLIWANHPSGLFLSILMKRHLNNVARGR